MAGVDTWQIMSGRKGDVVGTFRLGHVAEREWLKRDGAVVTRGCFWLGEVLMTGLIRGRK